jgi:hypothetical protein
MIRPRMSIPGVHARLEIQPASEEAKCRPPFLGVESELWVRARRSWPFPLAPDCPIELRLSPSDAHIKIPHRPINDGGRAIGVHPKRGRSLLSREIPRLRQVAPHDSGKEAGEVGLQLAFELWANRR